MTFGHSAADEVLDSDSDSSVAEYVPRSTRPKAPSIATRRRSRMLYLEKYGLNQPDWHKGSQDDYVQDQVEDDTMTTNTNTNTTITNTTTITTTTMNDDNNTDDDDDYDDEDDIDNNDQDISYKVDYPREERIEYLKGLSSSSEEEEDDDVSEIDGDMKSDHEQEDEYEGNDTPTSAELPHSLFTAEPESMSPLESSATTTTTTCIRSKSVEMKRPVSVRTFVQSDIRQRRPVRFIKPANHQPSVDSATLPSEFTPVHALVEEYHNKIYMEGYLYKRNDLNSNGKSCPQQQWGLWYVELCGPVLTLWDAETDDVDTSVLPIYINITDASVNMEPHLSGETSNHVFSLNSAGANRYLLQPPNKPSLEAWVLAIRLSCYECARIQEIYTREFMTRPMYRSILFPPTTKKSMLAAAQGYVQVRFPGNTGWKKYWAVVTNKQVQRHFFAKKKIIATKGQVMFYQNQKSKQPVMTLLDVAQAYTVYPESPKLIHRPTLFKIEGSLFKNKSTGVQQLVSASSSALVMTGNSEELVRWLVGVYDTFHLYGKPGVLFNDPTNKEALNFGHRKTTRGRLFLEPTDVYAVEPSNSLMETKANFNEILMNKILSEPAKRHTLSAFTELNIHPHHSSRKSRLRNTTSEDDRSSVDSRYHHPQKLNHHLLQQHNNEIMTSVSLQQSCSTDSEGKAPSFSSNNDSVLSRLDKRSSTTSRRPNSTVMLTSSHSTPMVASSSGSIEEYPASPSTQHWDGASSVDHHDTARHMFYNSTDSFQHQHSDQLDEKSKPQFQPLDPIDEKAMFERYFLEQKQQLIMMQQYMYQQYGPTILTDPKYMIPNELSLHHD